MTYLAAFDGTDLSRAALDRAVLFAEQNDQRLVVVCVLPTDRSLAETYGLVEGDEYDPEAAAERLREAVLEIAPNADVRFDNIDRYAGKGQIGSKIRRAAREVDAEIVFLGSDNAGRIVKPVTSVGGTVASSLEYDVFIVRSS
ncbi:universal stress protein [Natronomonas halophila]|uniref:universal stress protein n=1 Tax=Natronomonas halophila TaxID=2747817 RepID=UPI0015B609A7|nr:universal stress protein [Natronomonas halophila]QLD85340.1 universal stress protein [Natronomonas halophila]